MQKKKRERSAEDANLRVTITVPLDDDTCGQDFSLCGTSFEADIVVYHEPAKAWVVRHNDTGEHYFVDASFITAHQGDHVPKPTSKLAMPKKVEVRFQQGATATLEDGNQEDISGKWAQGTLLYSFPDKASGPWHLMRVPEYEVDDFYGGYAVGRGGSDIIFLL